ncbi:MAG: beta-galactosidase, partial [Acidobacteriaceae bacterium]
RTQLEGPVDAELTFDTLHDYAQIYIDGKRVGTIDRRLGQYQVPLHISSPNARLDVLVENTGRVNFGPSLPAERAGIVGRVKLGQKVVTGWDIYPLPMLKPGELAYSKAPCSGACFYRASFTVKTPKDTFLDTSALTKGEVWLNGRALGRFWNIGPQKALYVPAPWLKPGRNEVVVFDLEGKPNQTIEGLDHPMLHAAVEANAKK